jgi:hypothetical protein
MFPTSNSRVIRIRACRADLADNGLDPDALAPRALRDLARRDLDYFQAMLGYDAGVAEVLDLISRTREPAARTRGPRTTGGRRRP